jgi:LPS-assembly lipoprotein
MWWHELMPRPRALGRLVIVLAAAGLTAGCWEPVYGSRPSVSSERVQDKFAAVEVPPIVVPKGTPAERVAVAMFNALQFKLHNGGGPTSPTYRLTVSVSSSQFTAVVNPTSGRPDAQIDIVIAYYTLIEIASGKAVMTDSSTMHVDYDVPGSQQRFASQRAMRDAEDRAVMVVADLIRNRLASYFVAGT